MFEFFRNQSIKTKLTMVMLLISVLLLMVVSSVILVAEFFQSRSVLIQEMRILSSAMTANVRQPLVLGEHADAEKILDALSTQRHIHAAYLFDQHGQPVAQYLTQKKATLVWNALEADFHESSSAHWRSATTERLNVSLHHFGMFTPIFYQDNRVGTLYLLSDLDSMYSRLNGVIFAVILSLLLLFACSWWLAGRLQKPISEPLLNLTKVMKNISEDKKYSLRADKNSNDEVGELVEIFNRMLGQIEVHQQQQERYQQQLELTVQQRTMDLRSAIDELEVARKQADDANAAKSLFLSRMTHELRTPLIGVLGMNGLLLRTPLTEQQSMLVETVRTSGEDLLALISDVLDLSRIEAGKLLLELSEVDICQLIEEIVELLSVQAQDKGLHLVSDIPLDALWTVQADRAKIGQIMMNLIGNAIKFTAAGSVTVRVRCAEPLENNVALSIEVQDTGVGMSEHDSQRVFDLFYQLDNHPQEARNGSGLGLTIVKQLVALMNGSLHMSSTPNEGSLFRVDLTLRAIRRRRPMLPLVFAEQTVLLGIENFEQRTLLERRFRELGFNVQSVAARSKVVAGVTAAAKKNQPYGLVVISQQWLQSTELAGQLHVSDPAILPLLGERDIQPSETARLPVLSVPVTWRRLQDSLQSLALKKRVSESTSEAVNAPHGGERKSLRGKVLFIGRHAAIRQLLRLSLLRRQIGLDVFSELDPELLITRSGQYQLVLIDADNISEEILKATLAAVPESFPTCYLLGEQIGHFSKNIDRKVNGYLEKPLGQSALKVVLDTVFHQEPLTRDKVSAL